jgi:SAM-dependent methyltransferase
MSAPVEIAAEWQDTTRYERWFESSLGRAYAESVNATIAPWVADARPGLVVDVGCGPGITAGSVVPAAASLIELDCSLLMAARAKYRLARERSRVASVVGTCAAIPLRDASADLVLCINCLEFVADRELAFAELRRVLRPGGTAIIGVLNARSLWELTRRLKAPFVSKERTYYKKGRFFGAEELRDSLGAARFELAELRLGVHFPPVGSPLAAFYRACERAMRRVMPARGGVILTRSIAH